MKNHQANSNSIQSVGTLDLERHRRLNPPNLPLIASKIIEYADRRGIREKKVFREALRLTLSAVFNFKNPIRKLICIHGEPCASLLQTTISHAAGSRALNLIDSAQLSIAQLNSKGIQNLKARKTILLPLRNPVSMSTVRQILSLTLSDRISTSLNQAFASGNRKSVIIAFAESNFRNLPYSESLHDVLLPFQFKSEKISPGEFSYLKKLVTSKSEIRKFLDWLKWDVDPGDDDSLAFDWFEPELQQWKVRNNLLAHFINEACFHGPKLRIWNNDLYDFYCAFCAKHHHPIPLDVEDFGEQMGEEGKHTTSIGLRKNERPPEWKQGHPRPKRRFYNHMDIRPEYRKQLTPYLLSEKDRANRIHDQLRWG